MGNKGEKDIYCSIDIGLSGSDVLRILSTLKLGESTIYDLMLRTINGKEEIMRCTGRPVKNFKEEVNSKYRNFIIHGIIGLRNLPKLEEEYIPAKRRYRGGGLAKFYDIANHKLFYSVLLIIEDLTYGTIRMVELSYLENSKLATRMLTINSEYFEEYRYIDYIIKSNDVLINKHNSEAVAYVTRLKFLGGCHDK